MKEKDEYNLEEAIKHFYRGEPLKKNLANSVTNKLFEEQNNSSIYFDNWFYLSIGLIIVSLLVYFISILNLLSISSVLMMVIFSATLIGLSIKEFSVFSKKIAAIY